MISINWPYSKSRVMVYTNTVQLETIKFDRYNPTYLPMIYDEKFHVCRIDCIIFWKSINYLFSDVLCKSWSYLLFYTNFFFWKGNSFRGNISTIPQIFLLKFLPQVHNNIVFIAAVAY